MNNLKSFKDLSVWQKAGDLAVLVYKITEKFPRSELYGMVNQMRRAVISISSNIAEGFKRVHKREKLQFYNIAHSSVSELESQIEISKRLGFLSENDYQDLISITIEISKMNGGLIKSLSPKSYILNSKNGFTMVELLVAAALFVVVIGVVSGSFIRALRTQRATVALMSVNDNVSLTLEQMAREIRTGYNFDSYSPDELNFMNYLGQNVTYRLNAAEETIEKGIGDQNFSSVTAGNVKVKHLSFVLWGVPQWPNKRITISIGVGADVYGIKDVVSYLQTTVSARM